MTKRCPQCTLTKPKDAFQKNRASYDGLSSYCRSCRHTHSILLSPEERDRINARRREAWATNAKGRETQRNYRRKKQQTERDRLNAAMRACMYQSLNKQKHGRKWQQLVGYNADALRLWLEMQFEPGMTWENYGKWHIDHSVPIAAFKFNTPDDPGFKACWKLTNLRPLWKIENQKKGARCLPGFAEALTILARIPR